MTQDWKDSLKYFVPSDTENDEYNVIEAFIESLLKEERNAILVEERQFILNVLDGIDIADAQMGIVGGTRAIRQALQSRI